MIERISQSFMKVMREYVAGRECGNIVKRMFVEDQRIDYGSESMAAGSYFEFLVTGSMGKSGEVPMPQYMAGPLKRKTFDKLTVEDMTADYRRAHFNAATVTRIMKEIGLKIVAYNKSLVKGRFSGDLDIVCEFERDVNWQGREWKAGDRVVIDLKYSGLLNNRWEKMGWMWTELQKEYHGTQATQYNFLTGLPFIFWVTGSTNKETDDGFEPTEMKVFIIEVSERRIQKHVSEGNKLFDNLKVYAEVGLVPRPSYNKCQGCPIREGCSSRYDWPQLEQIDLE